MPPSRARHVRDAQDLAICGRRDDVLRRERCQTLRVGMPVRPALAADHRPDGRIFRTEWPERQPAKSGPRRGPCLVQRRDRVEKPDVVPHTGSLVVERRVFRHRVPLDRTVVPSRRRHELREPDRLRRTAASGPFVTIVAEADDRLVARHRGRERRELPVDPRLRRDRTGLVGVGVLVVHHRNEVVVQFSEPPQIERVIVRRHALRDEQTGALQRARQLADECRHLVTVAGGDLLEIDVDAGKAMTHERTPSDP